MQANRRVEGILISSFFWSGKPITIAVKWVNWNTFTAIVERGLNSPEKGGQKNCCSINRIYRSMSTQMHKRCQTKLVRLRHVYAVHIRNLSTATSSAWPDGIEGRAWETYLCLCICVVKRLNGVAIYVLRISRCRLISEKEITAEWRRGRA